MQHAIEEIRELDRELERLENLKAKDHLSVYCGLFVPQNVEADPAEIPSKKDGRTEPLDREGDTKFHNRSLAERYVPAVHHRLIVEKLEDIERGYVTEDGEKIPFNRLMIFAPPGSAKSTYASVIFPSWYLGRNPTHCILQGSYNDSLATRFGRRARNVYGSPQHRAVFGVGLASDSRASGEWMTERGGEYFSFGVNAGVTGRRANGVILDDLVKGRAEANSETVRETTWETYKSDVRTRLFPNHSWIIYIATRWHEDDPAGRILPKNWNGESGWVTAQDGERWYVLCLVAVVENEDERRKDPLKRKIGDVIWPGWFTKQFFAQEKATQGQYNWASLYQQRPQPMEGGIWKKSYFKLWPHDKPLPLFHFIAQSYDTAFTENTANDPSACTTWGIFKHRGIFHAMLVDCWKEFLEYPKLRRRAKLDKNAEYGEGEKTRKVDITIIENKGSGITLLQDLGSIGVVAFPYNPGKADAVLRLHSATPFGAAGMVWLLESAKNPGQPVSSQQEFSRDVLQASAQSDTWDYADTLSQFFLYCRNKNILEAKIATGQDEPEPEEYAGKKTHPYGA